MAKATRYRSTVSCWILRRRWGWIVGGVIAVAASAGGLGRLDYNHDSRLFFSRDDPHRLALEALEEEYTRNQGVVVVLAPASRDVFHPSTLALVEAVTEAAWGLPHVIRVDSVANFQHSWAEGDEVFVEDLVREAETLSRQDLDRIRGIALSQPQLVNRLISPSGHVTAVAAQCRYESDSTDAVVDIAEAARRLADGLRRDHPGLEVYLAGQVMSDTAFGEVSRRDLQTLVPAMVLVLIVLVGVALRSWVGTLSVLAVTVMSVATAMGLAGWMGITLTPAAAAAPTIILTLAVADSVHLLVAALRRLHGGAGRSAAMAFALRDHLWPIFLASATTAVGFLSMRFSDAPPFRDLGTIVAIGVTAALAYSVLFLPSLLSVLPWRPPVTARREPRWPDALAAWILAHPRGILWGGAGLLVLIGAGISRLEFNDDWARNFSRRYEIRRSADFVEQHLTGLYTIQYSLRAAGPEGIYDPVYLETVERFAAWYRLQPQVVHVQAVTDILKRLNRNLHGDDPSWHRVPDQRALAAQCLLLYELSLPHGLDMNDQVNLDRSATRLVATLAGSSTRELMDLDARAQAWLQAHAPPTMQTQGSSLSVIWAHLSSRNIRSMLGGSLAALALISLLLVFAFRDIKTGLLSLVPNLAPALMAFGIWGLSLRQVGIGLSVVVSMTLGIVVDDTVHFLSAYLRARRAQGLQPGDAIRAAFHKVGTAMWVSTLGLVAGFLVLTLSGYRMNAHMGLLSAITIALALVFDLVLLPVVLLAAEGAVGPWRGARLRKDPHPG